MPRTLRTSGQQATAREMAFDYPTRWGLVSHWKLDELSGTRVDSYGSNHLTDNNTVTVNSGKLGNAAQFTSANSEWLNIADNATVSTGDIDFWLGVWVYLDSNLTDMSIFAKGPVSGADKNFEFYLVFVASANRFKFSVGNSVTSSLVAANTFGAPPTGTWIFLQVWHDSINNTINIKINNGTTDTVSYSSGGHDNANNFTLGKLGEYAGYYFNGRIDSVSFGKSPSGGIASVIDEINNRLYYGGLGRSYPFAGKLSV